MDNGGASIATSSGSRRTTSEVSALASASMRSSSAAGSGLGAEPASDGAGSPVSGTQRICQFTPRASFSASRMTSALRASLRRLASGGARWLSTSTSPSTARTIASASIALTGLLRAFTFSRTVSHIERTAAASG